MLYALTSGVLLTLMVLAVLDGFGVVDAYGVDTKSTSATGGGYELTVRYGELSRPGLATTRRSCPLASAKWRKL